MTTVLTNPSSIHLSWSNEDPATLEERLLTAVRMPGIVAVRVEVSRIDVITAPGVALLLHAAFLAQQRHIKIRLVGARGALLRHLRFCIGTGMPIIIEAPSDQEPHSGRGGMPRAVTRTVPPLRPPPRSPAAAPSFGWVLEVAGTLAYAARSVLQMAVDRPRARIRLPLIATYETSHRPPRALVTSGALMVATLAAGRIHAEPRYAAPGSAHLKLLKQRCRPRTAVIGRRDRWSHGRRARSPVRCAARRAGAGPKAG